MANVDMMIADGKQYNSNNSKNQNDGSNKYICCFSYFNYVRVFLRIIILSSPSLCPQPRGKTWPGG